MLDDSNTDVWDDIIKVDKSLFSFDLHQIVLYKDLLFMLVKREFITFYKQTILGPLWILLQPLLTALTYIFIFGYIAGLSTDGAPKILFYLSGIATWTYFSTCLNKTATVFKDNQGVFGKVYFPRIVVPLSIIISNLYKFGIQFGIFILFWLYYVIFESLDYSFSVGFFVIPLLVVLMGLIALGLGLIITSMTTKYRDLVFLLQFGVQLFMYATPVIYPLSSLPEKYQSYMMLNPLTGILEGIKQPFLTPAMDFPWIAVLYSLVITLIVLFFGILVFNRTEKNFMDTV